MVYLVIPLLVFLGLVYFVYWQNTLKTRELDWSGKLNNLRFAVPILATAKLGERRLRLGVERRVTWLEVLFCRGGSRIELPLITKVQKSRRSELSGAVERLCGSAEVRRGGEDEPDVISAVVSGTPLEQSQLIQRVFKDVFDVANARRISFTARAHPSDLEILRRFTVNRHEWDDPGPAKGWTTETSERQIIYTRRGCMSGLVFMLVLPTFFVAAFYLSGLKAAVITGLAALLVFFPAAAWMRRRVGWQPEKKKQKTRWVVRALPLLTVLGAVVYLATGDRSYFQVLPAAYCLLFGAHFFEVWLRDDDYMVGPDGQRLLTRRETNLFLVSVVVLSIGGAVLSEYVRTNASLTAWVWYFAFLRMELMVGLFAAFLPTLVQYFRRTVLEDAQRERG
ncbi:MAG: hypothetical protein AAF441_19300 [Pseudomonadota bacterium]